MAEKKLTLFLLIFLGLLGSPLAQEHASGSTILKGKVLNSATKAPIDYANVFLIGTNAGTNTEIDGQFELEIPKGVDSVQISQIGFVSRSFRLRDLPNPCVIELEEFGLLLEQVVVTADPNPGKTLMKKVIAQKPVNNPANLKVYSAMKYSRGELLLNNLQESSKDRGLKELMLKTYQGLDTSAKGTGKLPIYFIESLSELHHSEGVEDQERLLAKKTLDLETDKMLRHLEKFNVDFNVYDNWLRIFEKTFASPVSDKCLEYYHFYIEDSIWVDGKLQLEVQFVPIRKYGETFTGTMRINDGSFSICSIEMKMDKTANLNFVNAIQYREEFSLQRVGHSAKEVYMPQKVRTTVTFDGGLELLGLPVKPSPESPYLTYINTHVFEIRSLDKEGQVSIVPIHEIPQNLNRVQQDESFWEKYRLDTLSTHERSIYQMVDTLRERKPFKLATKLATTAYTGYWQVNDKWSIGNYSSVLSFNRLEGMRFRLRAYTNPGLSEHWFGSAYAAYGIRDEKLKGQFEMGYLKSVEPWSKTGIDCRSDYDLLQTIDNEIQSDNLVSSVMLKPNFIFRRNLVTEFKFYHERQLGPNWMNTSSIAYRIMDPSFDYSFPREYSGQNTMVDTLGHQINTFEFQTNFRFSFGEKIVYSNYSIIHLDIPSRFPILNINYTHGFKTRNALFSYDKINIGISQFLHLPPKCLFFYNLQFGKTFQTLPSLLLNIPRGNEAFVSSRTAFNTMTPYEFVVDHYVSLSTRFTFSGVVTGRIPVIQKLGWRERVTFNTFWGDLTDANKAFNAQNGLINTPSRQPFAEVGVGVENILHLISIEYIRRLTLLDDPQTLRGGVFLGVLFEF